MNRPDCNTTSREPGATAPNICVVLGFAGAATAEAGSAGGVVFVPTALEANGTSNCCVTRALGSEGTCAAEVDPNTRVVTGIDEAADGCARDADPNTCVVAGAVEGCDGCAPDGEPNTCVVAGTGDEGDGCAGDTEPNICVVGGGLGPCPPAAAPNTRGVAPGGWTAGAEPKIWVVAGFEGCGACCDSPAEPNTCVEPGAVTPDAVEAPNICVVREGGVAAAPSADEGTTAPKTCVVRAPSGVWVRFFRP